MDTEELTYTPDPAHRIIRVIGALATAVGLLAVIGVMVLIPTSAFASSPRCATTSGLDACEELAATGLMDGWVLLILFAAGAAVFLIGLIVQLVRR